jgi:Do/DeqQ family serine protease
MNRAHSSLVFLAGSIVGGLALAFVAVALRPDLLPRHASAQGSSTSAAVAAGRAEVVAETATTASEEAAPPTTSRTEPPRSFAPAVERAAPAVVNVYTARVVTERLYRGPLDEFFGDLGPRYRQRVERALGSGVIVDPRGYLVTNNHVIANADSIRVQLADGREAEATIVGRDPDTDLAVLRISLGNLPVMPLGRSDQLRVGDVVLAIGNPIGLSQTVTFGIVSATGRGQLGVATFENFIQTDAAINVGNSGGALIDTAGSLVGINTAVVAKNLGVEGIGFAIPVNLVRGVLREIIAQGRVIRGWIGIAPEDIADEQARQLGLARGGVVITNLYVDSPALAAGLQPGDVIIAINGTEVRSAQEALTRIAQLRPGRKVTLRVQRGAQLADLPVDVTERPRARR